MDIYWLIAVLTLFLSNLKLGEPLDLSKCHGQLGMQNGNIPDSALSASSSYDSGVGPTSARIRTEIKGGSWCPAQMVKEKSYEYLQIDLGELKVVTRVETQGRFGNGQGQEYVEKYTLDYQREPNGPWYRFRNRQGVEIIQGNSNQYVPELRDVDPAIIARVIRFIPFSELPKFICLRVEIYGCTWEDGLVSYDMPQGERRGNDINLLDFTYDGKHHAHNMLTGGIGQLADGFNGSHNFRATAHNLDFKGYDWIGWRNDTWGGKPIEIVFKFDDVRNFTSLRIFSNNMFSRDVKVFKDAHIDFSIGGEHYNGDNSIEYHYMSDDLIEYARPVIIDLQHHIAKYIRVRLFFAAKWLIISEVHFKSTYAVGNFTAELPPKNRNEMILYEDTNTTSTSSNGTGASPVPSPGRDRDETIGIIIGVLVTLILLIVVVMAVCCIRQHKTRGNKLYGPRHPSAGKLGMLGTASCGGDTPLGTTNTNLTLMNDLSSVTYDSGYGGGTATLGTSGLKLANGVSGKLSNGKVYSGLALMDQDVLQNKMEEANISDNGGVGGGIVCPGIMGTWGHSYNRDALDVMQRRRLPELPRTPESTDTNTSREYAIPGEFMTMPHPGKSSVIVNIPPPPPPPRHTPGYSSPQADTPSSQHYASTDISGIDSAQRTVSMYPSIAGVSGSTLYSRSPLDYHTTDSQILTDLSAFQFPRENLKFLEKLGEGQFGEVHLCEATKMYEFLGDDYIITRNDSKPMRVVVKMLRTDVKENENEHFHREINIMCRLKDANIVRVLGVCSQQKPLYVIVEYMRYGDLSQYLKQHVPENTMVRKKKHRHLSYGCLIYMATQIASGLKYLESVGVVHRDVAARNCLVGPHFQIKVSDFGMSRSLHKVDYYRVEGVVMLPMRWMAWESLLMGKFSSKSDVWSFAVTLWEILSFAREQPYSTLTDDEVIENCARCLQDSDDSIGHLVLDQPSNCPKEIYDLMCECWKRDDTARPNFNDIHMFLMHKNVGYDPTQDDRSTHHSSVATLSKSNSHANGVPFV